MTSKFVNLVKLQELGRIEQVSESIIMAYNDNVEKVSFMLFFRLDLLTYCMTSHVVNGLYLGN